MWNDPDLARRVEEACLNGWPALRQIVYGGLLLRFSDGYTRRANSINAIAPFDGNPDEAIRSCETAYRFAGLPTIFRLSSAIDVGLDAALDRARYGPPEDGTVVLCRTLDLLPSTREEPHGVATRPSDAWLDALARLQGQSETARRTHRRILDALAVPAGFASAEADGAIAATCFGAVHEGIVCVNSVATDPRFRRAGLATRAIRNLLAWARHDTGARRACVPVVGTNTGAVSLYRRLGFDTEILRYHYRRRPE